MGNVDRNHNGSQEQTKPRGHNPFHVHPSPPASAEPQRDFVLRILKQAGPRGVNRDHFLAGSGPCGGRRVTQVGARINELEKEGYIFSSRFERDNKFVTYRLESEPLIKAERIGGFTFGKKAAASVPVEQPGLFGATSASGENKRFLDSELGKARW